MGGRIPPTSHQGNVAEVNKTGKTTQFATGSATLVAGTVTIPSKDINSKSIVLFGRTSVNSSTGIGEINAKSIIPGVSFVVNSLTLLAAVETDDVSIFDWLIIGG